MRKLKVLVDSDGVIAKWQTVPYEEVLKPGYFRRVPPMWEMLATVRRLTEQKQLEIYIVSCSPNKETTEDKQWWWDAFLPEVPKENRIVVPFGKNKCEYLRELGIRQGDVALDDFTPNLYNYRAAFPQLTPIKVMNGINGTKGRWVGARVSAFESPQINAKRIIALAEEGLLYAGTHSDYVVA